MLNRFGNNIAVAIFFEHEPTVDVKVNRSNAVRRNLLIVYDHFFEYDWCSKKSHFITS